MTRRKTVGYAKLGRSMPLQLANCGVLGGDHEMVPTLKLLAEAHPDVDFILVGRNSGEAPKDVGLPSNVYNPWMYWGPEIRRQLNAHKLNYPNLSIEDHVRVRAILTAVTRDIFDSLDGIVMWLGQHGTSNTPLPSLKDRDKLTKPYDWATLYGSYLLLGINRWRDVNPFKREEVLLNADARNYIKYRDAKWPWRHPVLAQYSQLNNVKHERWGDDNDVDAAANWSTATWQPSDGIWQSVSRSIYARLEISSLLPGTPFGDSIQFNGDWSGRRPFGIVVNETRRDVHPARARKKILQDWVLPLDPAFVLGSWSDQSQRELGRTIDPIPIDYYIPRLQTVRSTFTTPASGTGWATAKPWEAFAAGVVCFFHPAYDDQNHILGDAPTGLHDFLRVKTPSELRERVDLVNRDRDMFEWIVEEQCEHFINACRERTYLQLIEERLGL